LQADKICKQTRFANKFEIKLVEKQREKKMSEETKRCRKCKELKLRSYFRPDKRFSDKVRKNCVICEGTSGVVKKFCQICGNLKKVSYFDPDPGSFDDLSVVCSGCRKLQEFEVDTASEDEDAKETQGALKQEDKFMQVCERLENSAKKLEAMSGLGENEIVEMVEELSLKMDLLLDKLAKYAVKKAL
jgi:hypothetical protein